MSAFNKHKDWDQGVYRPTPAQASSYSPEMQAEFREREKCIIERGGAKIGHFETAEDAMRAVWCVNACKGLDTIALRAVASMGGLSARMQCINGLMADYTESRQVIRELSNALEQLFNRGRVNVSEGEAVIIEGLLAKARGMRE